MKNYLNRLNFCCLLLLIGSFYSCTKQEGELQAGAQNIYPLKYYGFSGKNWFLTYKELGIINLEKNLENLKLERVAFNFTNGHFSNNLADTFVPFWLGGIKNVIKDSKFIQLDETRFFQINYVWKYYLPNQSYLRTQVYLTNSDLKNKVLLTEIDSVWGLSFASLFSDGKIILFNDYNLTCLNNDYKKIWSRNLNSGSINDFEIKFNSIFTLKYLSNLTENIYLNRYDFAGKLVQTKTMSYNLADYKFEYLLSTQNGLLLTGIKSNKITHRQDFCLLRLDEDFNPISEKIIPITSVFPDWDFYLNDFKFGFSDLIPKPIMVNNYLWMAVPYYTDRSGSSLQLIKFNKELEVELVKPIITNIKQKISNVAVKANGEYLYLGGTNYKGCFFYRLDKNGDFK